MKELRDKKLYRETHNRFEDYLRDRFDFTKRKAYYLIDAVDVVENLKSEPLVHFLPTSERQCREVAKLPPEQQREVWHQAVEKAEGKVPPARIIKQVVKEVRLAHAEGTSAGFLTQIRGEEPMTESKTKYLVEEAEEIVTRKDMPSEYLIRIDRETYELLEEYRIRFGAETKFEVIRRLLKNKPNKNL